MSAATPQVLDMRFVDQVAKLDDTPDGFSGNEKARRARARRKLRQAKKITDDVIAEVWKPIEEWDMEELARGMPRDKAGTFRGRKNSVVSRELHEQIMKRFQLMLKQDLVGKGVQAMSALDYILSNDEVDRRGRPEVAPSVKMTAISFVVDHLIGKATQPITQDVSITLQGILGQVMVNPTEDGEYVMAQRGHIAIPGELVVDAEDDDD